MNVEELRKVVEKKIADNKIEINKFNENMTPVEMADVIKLMGFNDGVEWLLEMFGKYTDD